MTREDITRMARQVGYPIQHEEWRKATEEFAALVAAAERENFCAALRQMHDAYSLASDPSPLKTRSQS